MIDSGHPIMIVCKYTYARTALPLSMTVGGRTSIGCSKAVKAQFLREIIGNPKRFPNADEALLALMDCFERMGEADKAIPEDQDHGAEPS